MKQKFIVTVQLLQGSPDPMLLPASFSRELFKPIQSVEVSAVRLEKRELFVTLTVDGATKDLEQLGSAELRSALEIVAERRPEVRIAGVRSLAVTGLSDTVAKIFEGKTGVP